MFDTASNFLINSYLMVRYISDCKTCLPSASASFDAGPSESGSNRPPQILTETLTLFEPGEAYHAHNISTSPPPYGPVTSKLQRQILFLGIIYKRL